MKVVQANSQVAKAAEINIIGNDRLDTGEFDHTNIQEARPEVDDLVACIPGEITTGRIGEAGAVIAGKHDVFYGQALDGVIDLDIKQVE